MIWRVALVFMLSIAVLPGCLPAGENLLVVTGGIENYADLPRKSCELLVLDAGTRQTLYRVPVANTIRIDYTIAPQRKNYMIRVECVGSGSFESETITIGDRPKTEIELGMIHVRGRKENSGP